MDCFLTIGGKFLEDAWRFVVKTGKRKYYVSKFYYRKIVLGMLSFFLKLKVLTFVIYEMYYLQ